MKVGDLVRAKHKYSSTRRHVDNETLGIGIVLKVEEGFYGKNGSYSDYLEDRVTIRWIHGETTFEPDSYVEKLAENKK